MIPEIGIVVGLYVLVRLASNWKPWIVKPVTVLALLVTVLVVADLTVRGFRPDGIVSLMRGRPSTIASTSDKEPSATAARPTGSVTRTDGGSITTVLGYGFAVAKGSTLTREWIAVDDSTVPTHFDGTPGISTVYVSRQYGSEYRYRSKFAINTTEATQAVQVRFLTFDVWGEHVRTLSFEQVEDMPANTRKEFTGEWSLYSENEVEKHYASIAYIARVRLAGGRVVEAPTQLVLDEARKFSEKFTAAQLEPQPPSPPPQGRGGA